MSTRDAVNRLNDAGHSVPPYHLVLFVAGREPNSMKALAFLQRLRDEYLPENCRIEVVDVLEDYSAAVADRIMVVPALLVESPPPRRVIMGSLIEEDRVLASLGVLPKGRGR